MKRSGFSHITITVNHMADIIQAFFGDGSRWGLHIDYTVEKKALSTMGPLTLVKDLPNNFLVMNGDVMTDLDLAAFYQQHEEQGSIFTIASHRRTETIDYGLLHHDENNLLTRFEEKPQYDFLVSMGVYMVSLEALHFIPPDTFFGFDHLMYKLLEEKRPAKVFEYNGFWLDIGRPTDYALANEKVKDIDFKW